MASRLLPSLVLSLVAATFLVRHNEHKYYPGLFLWTTARIFSLLWSMYLTYACLLYPFLLSPLRHLPGPSGANPIWGYEHFLYTQPRAEMLYKWMESIPNDGLLHFRGIGNTSNLIATSPAALAEVLNTNSYDYVKPVNLQQLLARVLGWGVFLVEGQQHRFQRKNLLPAFHLRHIRELTGVFWTKSVELIDTMSQQVDFQNGNMEFGNWASRATLDIIGIAGMGHDFRAIQEPHQEIVEKYSGLLEPSAQKAVFFAANMIFPMWLVAALPWALNDDLNGVVSSLNRLARCAVEEKKAKLADGKERTDKDILSVALESRAFTDDELVAQLLTFLAAGHETTASALTWAIYLLAKNPDIQSRLRNEVRSILPSPRSTEVSPSWEDIESLPYLNAVANETLRYLPTAPITSRSAIRHTTILGYRVPKGTRILIVPWGTNKSTALWGYNANQFDPERWMAPGMANSGGAVNNYANLSFLHGPRSCIGQNFAKAEFKCLLAAITGRFEVEMQRKGEEVDIGGTITTKPIGGMNVRFKIVEGW